MHYRLYSFCVLVLCLGTAAVSVAPDPPRTLVLRPEALADARARLEREDPALQPVFDRLRAEADRVAEDRAHLLHPRPAHR